MCVDSMTIDRLHWFYLVKRKRQRLFLRPETSNTKLGKLVLLTERPGVGGGGGSTGGVDR